MEQALLHSKSCENASGYTEDVVSSSSTIFIPRTAHRSFSYRPLSESVETSVDGSSESSEDLHDFNTSVFLPIDEQFYGGAAFFLREYHVNDFDDVFHLCQQLASNPTEGHAFIGEDEYPTEENLRCLLLSGLTLLIVDRRDDTLLGYLCITNTKFSRSNQKNNADVIMGLSRPALTQHLNIFREVTQQAFVIAQSLLYAGVLVESFSTNFKQVADLLELGFQEMAEIPCSSFVKGQGLLNSRVFMKKTQPNATGMHEDIFDLDAAPYCEKIGKKKILEYLPLNLTTKTSFSFCLDYMKSGDMREISGFIRESAVAGRGYTHDDLEELDESDACLTDPHSTYLGLYDLDRTHGSKPFGALVFCPNNWVRAVAPCIADVWIIVSRSYEGRGVGSVLSSLWQALPGDLGYTGLLIDVFSNNLGMLKIMQKLKYRPVGRLPRCGNVIGAGWTDACLFYTPTSSAHAEGLLPVK